MNALTKCFTIIFIALVTLSGCDDDVEGPNVLQDGKIRGTLIDSTGNPVANASVSLYFEPCPFGEGCKPPAQLGKTGTLTDLKLLNHISRNDELFTPFPNPINGTSSIPFHIDDTTNAKIWVTKFCSEDTIVILVDDILVPGDYTLSLVTNDSIGYNYINGGYYINMVTDDHSEKILVIIQNSEGDTKTDADGSFILEQDCLPFGTQYGMTGVFSPEILEIVDITRYIGFFITLTNDEIAIFDSIFVDSLTGTDVILELK